MSGTSLSSSMPSLSQPSVTFVDSSLLPSHQPTARPHIASHLRPRCWTAVAGLVFRVLPDRASCPARYLVSAFLPAHHGGQGRRRGVRWFVKPCPCPVLCRPHSGEGLTIFTAISGLSLAANQTSVSQPPMALPTHQNIVAFDITQKFAQATKSEPASLSQSPTSPSHSHASV